MKLKAISPRWLLKIIVGLPLAGFMLLTIIQLPRLFNLIGHDPYRLGLALLQGGLLMSPYCFYALAIWFGADTIFNLKLNTPPETLLRQGLKRCGICLGAASLALYVGSGSWAWRVIYNNYTPQPAGSGRDLLYATATLLLGVILYCLAERIHYLQKQKEALTSELGNFV